MSATASEVKKRSSGASFLEGWQLGVIVVGAAFFVAVLAVPRPVDPDVLPAPRVDWQEAKRSGERDRERARVVEREPLPFEVRAVGESLRSFGVANAAGQPYALAEERANLPRLAKAARELHGDEPLARLEAAQVELFLAALADFERGTNLEAARREIDELGGNFLEKARKSGWLTGERELAIAPHERRCLFRVRWSEITGLRAVPAFAPSANEWRIYYRFLLEHPEAATPGHDVAEEQLKLVAAVEKYDPDYPGLFARGVLYFRLRSFAKAEEAFRGHLLRHPDGAWRLRAQNHLRASAERAAQSAPEL